MNVTSILDRFLEPVTQILPPDTARQIIDLHIDPQLQARLDVLAEKVNEGTLSTEEYEEYAEYAEGLDLIAIFKMKARPRFVVKRHDRCRGSRTRAATSERPM
jgi:hypothetical protein